MSDYVVYIWFRVRNRITGACTSSSLKADGELNDTTTNGAIGAIRCKCLEEAVLPIAPLQSEIFNDFNSSLIAEIGILVYAFGCMRHGEEIQIAFRSCAVNMSSLFATYCEYVAQTRSERKEFRSEIVWSISEHRAEVGRTAEFRAGPDFYFLSFVSKRLTFNCNMTSIPMHQNLLYIVFTMDV